MTFFTAAEVRPAARLVFTSWYYKCVGKSAAPACPDKKFVENHNSLPTVQTPLPFLLPTRRPEGLRQSGRVSFRTPLEASWMDPSGMVRRIAAVSLLVSRNGGVLRITEKVLTGQEISLKRLLDGDSVRTARARILAEIDREPEGFLYAVHILEPRSDFWDIEFPAPHKADQEALARLLMECGFCQRREVVYLNELELKSFESRKCIARICKVCEAPAVWIEAQSEFAPADSPTTRAEQEVDRVIPL